MRTERAVIAAAGTLSTPIRIQSTSERACYAIVGIWCPTGMSAHTGYFQYSQDGTNWVDAYDSLGVQQTFSLGSGRYVTLKPADYANVPEYVRLVITPAVGSERVFQVVLRHV